jgi:N,N'-diacetyllegionaminate synthase
MTATTRSIADRTVGPGYTPLVIAELGVNHDGNADKALRLVESAADVGADAIKTQIFEADRLLATDAGLAEYQRRAGELDPREMLRRLQLSHDNMLQVHELARACDLLVVSTIFTPELVAPAVDALPIDALKLASPDLVNTLLIDACRATGLPCVLSTGASTMEEIDQTIDSLGPMRDRAMLMQCVSAYPTPQECASLGAIRTIAQHTAMPVGYSDHTMSVRTGALAVAAGACFLEKHLTHDRLAAGPDHASSLDTDGMREYIALVKEAFAMLGDGSKQLLDIERDVREVSRQSLVLRRSCTRGESITMDLLTTARPGTGITPARASSILGMILKQDLLPGTLLLPEHLASATVPTSSHG